MLCLSKGMSKKYRLIEDFESKRRTFTIFNLTLRNFLAVKSSKQRSKHDEFCGCRAHKKFARFSLLKGN